MTLCGWLSIILAVSLLAAFAILRLLRGIGRALDDTDQCKGK
jgi:hypothetical protein